MTAKPLLRSALLLLLLAFPVLDATADGTTRPYRGEARDERGELVYTEHHQVRSTESGLAESVTEYRAPDGTLIATLRSDYSRSLTTPTYIFEDLRRNHREGLRWEGGTYVVFHQTGSAPEKTAPLRRDREVFSCQGWHYHLVDNLDLLEKENLTLNLVLPSELRPYPFVVKTTAADARRVSAELRLKNWLIRHFAPTLRLEYDRENRRLHEFHGVSNIPSSSGDRQTVTIRYTYPEE